MGLQNVPFYAHTHVMSYYAFYNIANGGVGGLIKLINENVEGNRNGISLLT